MQIFAFALLALALALGSSLFDASRSQQSTSALQAKTSSGALLSQAQAVLNSEASDIDADGLPEPLAGLSGIKTPAGGYFIPFSSGAPKADAWGTPIGYCPVDHGTANTSSGRITGESPSSQASVVFALISAGEDKAFQTGCEQALLGQVLGDDGVRTMTVGQSLKGVGGTQYFGDPVADPAALAALNPSALKNGELRLVLSTNEVHRWDSSGGSWVAVAGGGEGGGLAPPSYQGARPVILHGGGAPVLTHAGSGWSFLLGSDGQVYAAGKNYDPASGYSAWGDMTADIKLTYYPIPDGTDVASLVSGGYNQGAFIKNDKTLWTAGNANGTSGMLGTGDTNSRAVFTQVGTNVEKAMFIASGLVALKEGKLYFSGVSGTGMLAANTTSLTLLPNQFGTVKSFASFPNNPSSSSCLLRLDDDGTMFGRGSLPYCGFGSAASTNAWAALLSDVSNMAVARATSGANIIALKSDGTLWRKGGGGVSLGTYPAGTAFVQEPAMSGVSLLTSCRDAFFAVKEDGSLWGLGVGSNYVFGNGSTANLNTWTQIPTISNVVGIYPELHLCNGAMALTSDGSVWATGGDSGVSRFGTGTTGTTFTTWTKVR